MSSKKYNILYLNKFVKSFKKLSDIHKKMVLAKISILADNPSYPSLRTKPLMGTYDYHESSINMDIRVIWRYKDDRTITLMDVGHHDILDGY